MLVVSREVKNYNDVDPEWYERKYDTVPREDYLKEHWEPVRAAAIQKYCQNKSVLDLGCGTGIYTRIINKCAKSVLGLDISERMLNYARGKEKLELILADAHDIPLKRASVDVIVSIGLLEYVDREPVIKESERVLKASGLYLISVPNKYGASAMAVRLVYKLTGRQYLAKEPSRQEMLKLLGENGFEVMEFRMDDGLVALPDFLDRLFGKRLYWLVEKMFSPFKRNPFSKGMFFVARKGH